MSSSTWTRAALGSSAIPLKARYWRVVEAQSIISTMKLSDTLEEQAVLEALIEKTKFKVPDECKHLGYLLLTPFRYVPYPSNSRFRRAGSLDGVFYASESNETAIAETAFHRLIFYAESPETPWPTNPGEYTAFAVDVVTARAADLTRPPLRTERAAWTDLTDYTACLDFADAARAADLEAIRYESVRDPQARCNVALLTCRVFAEHDLVERQTWHLHLSSSGVRAICEAPAGTLPFGRNAFAADPRISPMRWDR